MEQKYTPGPWKHQRPNDVDRRHKVMSGPSFLDMVALPNSGFGYEEVEANARLIAAAPELLEALRDATDRLEKALVIVGSDPEYAALGVARLRETIAKAAS